MEVQIHESIRKRVRPLKMVIRDPVHIEMDGHVILIDRNDLPIFTNFHWYVEIGKGQTNYLRSNVSLDGKRRTVFIHQMILGIHDTLEIDHINGNGLDNRRSNIRLVSHMENQNNQRKRKGKTTSKYVGVSACKRNNNWGCFITYKNKSKNLGRFPTEIEAAVAYNNYIIKHNLPKNLNNV